MNLLRQLRKTKKGLFKNEIKKILDFILIANSIKIKRERKKEPKQVKENKYMSRIQKI